MARHRYFRGNDFEDDRYDEPTGLSYSESMDDNTLSMSPTTQQFLIKRNESNHKLADFIIEEREPVFEGSPPAVVSAQPPALARVNPVLPRIVSTPSPTPPVSALQRPLSPVVRPLSPAVVGPERSVTPTRLKNAGPAPVRIRDTKPDDKGLLNLVVIGHVDAGKSTIMGHLLYQLEVVGERAMSKMLHESKKLGKSSFAYAWILDETDEERERGVTMDVAQTQFETKTKRVTLLDAPGHKDFIPRMITGAATADAAVLVVNATRGEFETGFDASGGQTREHAMLARSLGISSLVVAVNKLDTVDEGAQETRYEQIKELLVPFLRSSGYDKNVKFVPVCGLQGVNLTVAPKPDQPLSSWYSGPSLVDLIDSLPVPPRSDSQPLRFAISDVFRGHSSGLLVIGKVLSGSVGVEDKVVVMPCNEIATVKAVTQPDGSEHGSVAWAGVVVQLSLTGIASAENLAAGDVLCHCAAPVSCVSKFQARIVTFNLQIPLTRGYQVELHYQAVCAPAVISRLLQHLDKSTGLPIKKNPRCLCKNSSGLIEITMEQPICLELYKDCRELGRVTLRSNGATVAAGLVVKLN